MLQYISPTPCYKKYEESLVLTKIREYLVELEAKFAKRSYTE
jgi:hypothetical protein